MAGRMRRKPVVLRRGLPGRVTAILRPVADAWPWWRGLPAKGRLAIAAGTAVVVVLAGYLLWVSGGPAPRARQYLTFKACLLTDSQGIAGKRAAPVWAGMNTASLETRVRIQYLPVFGPATVANALPYLSSLVQRRCDIIVAVGDAPMAAITTSARRYPKNRFVVVGRSRPARNIVAVNAPDAEIPTAMSKLITDTVRA